MAFFGKHEREEKKSPAPAHTESDGISIEDVYANFKEDLNDLIESKSESKLRSILENIHDDLLSEDREDRDEGYQIGARREGAKLFLDQHPQILEIYNRTYNFANVTAQDLCDDFNTDLSCIDDVPESQQASCFVDLLNHLHENLESEAMIPGYENNAKRDGARLFLDQHPEILARYNEVFGDQDVAMTTAKP